MNITASFDLNRLPIVVFVYQDSWLTVEGQKWEQGGTTYSKINEAKDTNDPIMPEASSLSLASCSVSEVPSSPAHGLVSISRRWVISQNDTHIFELVFTELLALQDPEHCFLGTGEQS